MSFGDALAARTATVSLNPSWIEFQSKSGAWLLGASRRLASLRSLGKADPRDLTDSDVEAVLAESNAYFRGPNWYRGWFHWLQGVLLDSVGSSYLDGSACHLDLVQWATKPAQGKLSPSEWLALVEADRDFLHWQLTASPITQVLVNGRTSVEWMERAGLVQTWDREVIPFHSAKGLPKKMDVFSSTAEGVQYVGWSVPVAQAISADGRQRLTSWVRSALSSH